MIILTESKSYEPSKGHLGDYTYQGTTYEVYEDAKGDIWRAPISSVIDVRTGYRIGRWEGPKHQRDYILKSLGIEV